MKLFGGVGEPSLRGRRTKRLLRTWRRRCPLLFFSLSLLSIVYFSFFGAKLPFDRRLKSINAQNQKLASIAPRQKDAKQCGYYVMRFMRQIVEEVELIERDSLKSIFTQAEYSREQIDEVRSELAECIQDHIYE